MDITGIKGPSNLPPEKGPKAAKKDKADKASTPTTGNGEDVAQISDRSSQQAESIDLLAKKAAAPDQGRQDKLAEVKARLDSGELDRPEVFKETAEKIMRGFTG